MVQKLIEKWNGGKKAFLSALLGALLGAIPIAITVGEYKGRVDTLDTSISRHLNEYTPKIAEDYQGTKRKVDVQEEKICELQRSLNEIKEQNKLIIRIVQSKR